jgi:hypothetical protein
MHPRASDQQTVNNYINGARELIKNEHHYSFCSGGRGGRGGEGHGQGTGGPGGRGMGPTLNYYIRAGNFTMNNQYVGSVCLASVPV